MKHVKTLTFVMLLSSFISAFAQAPTEENTDTLGSVIEKLQSDVQVLSRIKISGYVQAQYQKADTVGVESVAGGNFSGLDNRFQVRRGRIKFGYTGVNAQIVTQFELSEKGVSTKEIYGIVSDPWFNVASVTGGVFNRPFGFEVEYSSASLESPERSRIMQTLFPGECDLGGKLTLQAPKTSNWNFLKLDAGLFAGNGIAAETDKYKDLITHLSFKKSFLDEKLSVSGGASYYMGGWAAQDTSVYKMGTLADSSKGFVRETIKLGSLLERQYIGFDAQINLETAIGITSLRSEYIFGQQPATNSTTNSPTGIYAGSSATTYTTKATTDALGVTTYETKATTTTTPAPQYIRNFNGGYITLIQGIGQTKHKFVVKYDWYDPNTAVSGNQISKASTWDTAKKKLVNPTNLSYADIKYTTLGFGYIYNYNSNVRLTAYYDMVTNETTNAEGLRVDSKNVGNKLVNKDRTDNVFTLRILYKF